MLYLKSEQWNVTQKCFKFFIFSSCPMMYYSFIHWHLKQEDHLSDIKIEGHGCVGFHCFKVLDVNILLCVYFADVNLCVHETAVYMRRNSELLS